MNRIGSGFKKSQRLLAKIEFDRVFKNPLRLKTSGLVFLIRKNNLDHPRLGFALAKKQVRRAHDRNLIKRVVRESFRLNQNQLNSIDIVVVAQHGVGLISRRELRFRVDQQWPKLSQLCEN